MTSLGPLPQSHSSYIICSVAEQTDVKIRHRVYELIASCAPELSSTPIEEADLINDLGYHSLAIMELAFVLEEEFDLALIDEERTAEIRTAREVADYVLSEVRAQA